MARSLLFLALFLLFLVLSVSAHGGHSDTDVDSGSPSEKPKLRSRSLILVKIWCLILMFVGTFACGMSPYFMKWNEGFLVFGTQFAGGVFLGTGLMHFLSDSNETFRELISKEYPFAFMLASAGYLLTMLADCLVSHVYGKRETDNGSANGGVDFQANALLRMIPDRPLLSCAAYAFAFAISSPVGVAVGIIIDATTQGAVADWIFAISMGLACGVFIYVSINHLLSKGYKPQKMVSFDTRGYRFLAVLLGVGVIDVVMIWDT
ncbi:hypothetical protein OROMI_012817 [Orobanche minor]